MSEADEPLARRAPKTAVLVIDMMNAYAHSDAEKLTASVEKTATHHDLVASALDGQRADLVKPIVPPPGCRFLAKVRHRAFYSTALEYLLKDLHTRRMILTGQVTGQCILYTALDAYIRHFSVTAAADAVAHIDPELSDAALTMMQRNMRAELVDAAACLP